jgi:hypothetical protein
VTGELLLRGHEFYNLIGRNMLETVLKAIVFVLVPYLIKWIIQNFSTPRVVIKKQRLESMASFLAWPIHKKNSLIVQEKFKEFFNYLYTYEEIVFCLSVNNPLHAFSLLKTHSAFLELNKESTKIIFKENYATQKQRRNYKIHSNVMYFLFSFIGLLPIYTFDFIVGAYGLSSLPFILMFSVFMVMVSFFCLNESLKPNSAEFILSRIQQVDLSLQSN